MEAVKPTILLIDDEIDILETLASLFEVDEYKILQAKDGFEGLKIITESKIDLVVCDYMMPKMDGLSLLKEIRHKKFYTPFIFFSGNADDGKEHDMINLGAFQLVHKTEIKNLRSIVKKTLNFNENLKDLPTDSNEETDDFMKLLHSSK